MKIRPEEAELFHGEGQTDRQTDMTELIVVSGNFVYAPETRPRYAHFWQNHNSSVNCYGYDLQYVYPLGSKIAYNTGKKNCYKILYLLDRASS